MTKLVSKILGFFLSDVTAGACVPEHGECCPGKRKGVGCTGVCQTLDCRF